MSQVQSQKAAEDFVIRELDRSDDVIEAVFAICSGAFTNVSLDKLRSNWLRSHPGSTFLGAFHDGKLAAVNGFLAHPIMIKGTPSFAFQSCWSATKPDYRGKGLFTRIINEAKLLLAGRCAFLCGFPNAVSGPIFSGKLGFHSVPMVRNLIWVRGTEQALQAQIDIGRWFAGLENDNLIRFDQYAISDWKLAEGGGHVAVEHNTNFIWGRVGVRRIAGVKFKVLLAGGVELNKPQLFGRLMQEVRKASGVSIVRFVSASGSLVDEASRWTRHGDRTEPFIFFPVDSEIDGLDFDAHTGMKDVY
jgi:GNAT superfamily N-acetyltransferase